MPELSSHPVDVGQRSELQHEADHHPELHRRGGLLAVYCPGTGGVYMVPCDETTRGHTTLRLRPTANRQAKGIRWAADYALERFNP